MIEDRRTEEEKAATRGFVVATDKFMSGWGLAPGRSLYALAVTANDGQIETVTNNMSRRSEMKRVRFNLRLPKLRRGDHLSIEGPSCSPRFYTPNGF
jgi:hypothetical protein